MKKNKYIAVKKSTYKRLKDSAAEWKEKHDQRLHDIRIMVEDKGSINATGIEFAYQMMFDVERFVFAGSPNRHGMSPDRTPTTNCCVCGKDAKIFVCHSDKALCSAYNPFSERCTIDKCKYSDGVKCLYVCSDNCKDKFTDHMLS